MKIIDLISTIANEFSPKNALNILYEISKHHRIQGSTGLVKASEFIENYMRSLDYDVKVVEFPYDGVSEFYGVKVSIGWDVYDASLHLIKPKNTVLHRFIDSPTLVIAHSPSTKGRFVEGKLTYVGPGFSENFKNKDVYGKFVLTYGGAHRVFTEAASKGAVGVLVFRKNSKVPEAVPYYGLFLTKEEVEKYSSTIALSISENTAKKLLSYLERGVEVVLKAYVKSEFKPNKGRVIIADYEGRENSFIGFIAHYCHPSPSANDNASGTATLMEVARVVKSIIGNKLKKPDLGFRFIWVPEYTGTYALASLKPNYVKSIVYAINLDMVGEAQEKTGSTFIVFRTPWSRFSLLNAIVEYVTENVIGRLRTFGGLGKLPLIKYSFEHYSPGSDHDVFNILGIPSIMLNQWPDKFYHTDLDSPDKVDPEMLRIAGTISLTTAYIIASKEYYRMLLNIAYHWLIEFYHKMSKTSLENVEIYDIRCRELKHKTLKALRELNNLWPESKELISRYVKSLNKVLIVPKGRPRKVKIKGKFKGKTLKLKERKLISIRMLREKLTLREYEEIIKLMEETRELKTLLYSAMMMLWDGRIKYDDIIASLLAEYGVVYEEKLDRIIDALIKAGYIEVV